MRAITVADQRWARPDIKATALLPNTDDIATSISVRTVRGGERTVVAHLQEQYGNLGYETWLDLRVVIDSQTESFGLIKQILRVVSLLVGAVTITIVTYVDLVGKRRTIGIERAIGIRSNAIVWSYVLKAVAYALAGTAVGIALFLGGVVPLAAAGPATAQHAIAKQTSLAHPQRTQRLAQQAEQLFSPFRRTAVDHDPSGLWVDVGVEMA